MPFSIDSNPTPGEISEALNYLLGNAGSTYDLSTGQVLSPTGGTVGYLYKYIHVKYADSFDGTLNFSNTPTNKGYYGIRNNDSSTESTNPADYVWYKVTGGFGTTKSLYYLTTGGRSIQFSVSTSTPNAGWLIDPGTAIDLDVTTATNAVANFVVIRVANNSAAPTDAECITAIGRTPIAGDICTINYNSGIASIVYKYTTGWAVFQKYITGDLIVANSIVGNNIAANTITAGNMNVSQLSAITANLGTVTAGAISGTSLTVGTSPAVSGTTMTGSGAVVNTNGTFALGNSTTNISFNNTQMTLNGNVVATANVNPNAITLNTSSYTAGTQTLGIGFNTVQTVSYTSSGSSVLIVASCMLINSTASNQTANVRITRNGTVVYGPSTVTVVPNSNAVFCSTYSDVPSSGAVTYNLDIQWSINGQQAAYATLSALETKR